MTKFATLMTYNRTWLAGSISVVTLIPTNIPIAQAQFKPIILLIIEFASYLFIKKSILNIYMQNILTVQ